MLHKKWINWRIRFEDKVFNFLLERRVKHLSDFKDAIEEIKFERFPLDADDVY